MPRAQVAALGLLAGYAAWSYLSITWADQQGAGLGGREPHGALPADLRAVRRSGRSAPRGARAAAGRARARDRRRRPGRAAARGRRRASRSCSSSTRASPSPPATSTPTSRSGPSGCCPACCLAVRARGLVRRCGGSRSGGAGLLGALALMGQSRGWVLALPLGAACSSSPLGPGRVRELALDARGGGGPSRRQRPGARRSTTSSPVSGFDGAARRRHRAPILVMTAVLALLGLAAGARRPARRAEPPASAALRPAPAVGGGRGVACVGGAVALVAADGQPVHQASPTPGTTFKDGGATGRAGRRRASRPRGHQPLRLLDGRLGPVRRAPGRRHRRGRTSSRTTCAQGKSDEQPALRRTRFELGVLAQTGLVGALLLLGALRGRRSRGAARRCAAAGRERGDGGGGAADRSPTGSLHGSVDWFWEFPALAGAAWLGLGLAGSLAPRGAVRAERSARPRRRNACRAAQRAAPRRLPPAARPRPARPRRAPARALLRRPLGRRARDRRGLQAAGCAIPTGRLRRASTAPSRSTRCRPAPTSRPGRSPYARDGSTAPARRSRARSSATRQRLRDARARPAGRRRRASDARPSGCSPERLAASPARRSHAARRCADGPSPAATSPSDRVNRLLVERARGAQARAASDFRSAKPHNLRRPFPQIAGPNVWRFRPPRAIEKRRMNFADLSACPQGSRSELGRH